MINENASTDTPAGEAPVTLQPPPDSGSGGNYPSQEIPSSDPRTCGCGPYPEVTPVQVPVAPGYGGA